MCKLPISAVVVTYNEELHLEECLKSIDFCKEIVVIDLGSTDDSIVIATQYATKVIHHERVSVVEIIHAKIKEFVKYEWVLITDPDEIADKILATEIIELFKTTLKDNLETGAVIVPWRFYFKNKLLKGTIWGGINKRLFLVHLNRFIFTEKVHSGRKIALGYKILDLKFSNSNVIHHYWMTNYRQLIKKHRRYIQQEGKTRYENRCRTEIKTILLTPYRAFKECFFIRKGYKDGIVGLFLSVFWVWYSVSAEISLYKYQKKM